MSVSAVNGSAAAVGNQITLVSGAQLTVNADGSYVYDPNGAFDNLPAGQSAFDSFEYTVSDGNGGVDTATATIEITGENTAPGVQAGDSTELNILTLQQTVIDGSVEITDPDDTFMEGGTVAITAGMQNGDQLIFNNQNGITGVYDPGQGILTLSGQATIEDYELALESVEFAPGGGILAILGEREFTFTVDDGDVSSPADAASTAFVNVL